MSAPERLDADAFHARVKAQGVPRVHVAFRCVMCGTVQSLRSFERAGVGEEQRERQIGFSCVGRHTGAGPWESGRPARRRVSGCDWTLGGLLSFCALVVVDHGREHRSFAAATPDEAQALMARDGETVAASAKAGAA